MNTEQLDGNRIVYIKRKLRYPEGEVTYEAQPFWLAEAIVAEAPYELNTQSLWVIEKENL